MLRRVGTYRFGKRLHAGDACETGKHAHPGDECTDTGGRRGASEDEHPHLAERRLSLLAQTRLLRVLRRGPGYWRCGGRRRRGGWRRVAVVLHPRGGGARARARRMSDGQQRRRREQDFERHRLGGIVRLAELDMQLLGFEIRRSYGQSEVVIPTRGGGDISGYPFKEFGCVLVEFVCMCTVEMKDNLRFTRPLLLHSRWKNKQMSHPCRA